MTYSVEKIEAKITDFSIYWPTYKVFYIRTGLASTLRMDSPPLGQSNLFSYAV